MASVPVKKPAVTAGETAEQRFRRLEQTWKTSTAFLSSDEELVNHPAFQEIIRMGEAVVPFMLRDLQDRPRLWVWALPQITGADPVPAGDRGNIAKMSAAWLSWGKAHGYGMDRLCPVSV
jgi:hypothetical protein